MKKLVLKLAIIIVPSITFIVIVQSCCKQSYKITSKVMSADAWTIVGQARQRIDTIKSNFLISVLFEQLLVSTFQNPPFINSVYATKCNNDYLNTLLPESFSLTVSRPFLYHQDTVPVTENLIRMPGVNLMFYSGAPAVEVAFSQEFIDNTLFQTGAYSFTLKGMTSDNIQLISMIDLYIKIPYFI